mgnify:CR=1 FL=1
MILPTKITMEYLDKLDKGEIVGKNNRIGFPSLGADIMIKTLFKFNPNFTKNFILSVCHLDYNPEDVTMTFLDNELEDPGISTKRMITDFNVRINDDILINMEVNRAAFESVKLRNDEYQSRLKTSELKKGDNYNKLQNLKFIQLNLNFYEKNLKYGEDIVCAYSLITKTVFLEQYRTYVRYLDYYRNLYYNEYIEKSISDYYLALLTATSFKEFYTMLGNIVDDDTRESLIKDVIIFTMDSLFSEEELKALDKIVEAEQKRYYDNKFKEKFTEGRTEGQVEKAKEIAKNLLSQNISLQIIANATGLSKEEIEGLK